MSSLIEIDNVSFDYTPKNVILENVSFKVETGTIMAIAGPNGAGKSTLLNLICGALKPKSGRILIDGQDIREFSLSSLRGNIGLVSQETILFNDTVKANIAYGRPDASLNRVMDAAVKAHAHDFINRLPQGYDTLIGERGMALSGGERQRIAIARALLKDPPILILDEATSHLDTASERIVQQALEKLMQGRTVFMVAHRLSTVQNASNIVVLDRAKIVEQGSHEQLLRKRGLYSRLYQMQAGPGSSPDW